MTRPVKFSKNGGVDGITVTVGGNGLSESSSNLGQRYLFNFA